MRKFLLVINICFLGLGLKAQTLEQTTEYIQTTVQPYLSSSWTVSCAGDSLTSYATITHFKDIKGVNYLKETSNGSFQINLIGQCCYDFNHTKIMNSNPIYLNKNTPIPVVEKIIKAIKHAAELQGAKLVNENMF